MYHVRSDRRPFLHLTPLRFRILAGLCLVGALAVEVRDADATAERRMALAKPAPLPAPLSQLLGTASRPGAEVAIVAQSAGRVLLRYRDGLATRKAALWPLHDAAGSAVLGYAVVDLSPNGINAAQAAAASGIWTGLVHVPPSLDRAARAALDLPPAALGLALHDAPRGTVLSRTIRSPIGTLLWTLALGALLASHSLSVREARLARARRRETLTRGWLTEVRPAEPMTAKARARFGTLAEVEEVAAPKPSRLSWLKSALSWRGSASSAPDAEVEPPLR